MLRWRRNLTWTKRQSRTIHKRHQNLGPSVCPSIRRKKMNEKCRRGSRILWTPRFLLFCPLSSVFCLLSSVLSDRQRKKDCKKNLISICIQNFSTRSFPRLKTLSLKNCGLSSLNFNTFDGLANLESIDLSRNRLRENAIHKEVWTMKGWIDRNDDA